MAKSKRERRLMIRNIAMKSWKYAFAVIFLICMVGILYSGYFLYEKDSLTVHKSNFDAYFAGRFLQNKFSNNELNKDYNLDLENEDVIVFLHIQKTGGTSFGKHLVHNLDVDSPCNCRKRKKTKKRKRKHCDCLTKNKQVWLFSRYSTGWKCGLHADWTELTACVDKWFQTKNGTKKRRYHYITLLRDPIARFVSEWMHVQRGATWKASALRCNGREATLEEVPFCFTSENWEGVTLEEFLACRHNLAFNRQTRMLANLSEVHCYNTTAILAAERERLMLESAKENLVNMAFFGLLEFQTYTQFLFEHTLNINFINDFVQNNVTRSSGHSLTSEELKKIADVNHLDIELYQFAKDLFLQRVRQALEEDDMPVPDDLSHLILQADQADEESQPNVRKENENENEFQNMGPSDLEHEEENSRKRFISSQQYLGKASESESETL